jgi:hypothetical protein
VAGVQDMRFQELMPDVFHWLGIARIDRWASMSNMKHDALTSQGIAVVEQVAIPRHADTRGCRVEMDAKKAAGYYAPEPAQPCNGDVAKGPRARRVSMASPPTLTVRLRSSVEARRPRCASDARRSWPRPSAGHASPDLEIGAASGGSGVRRRHHPSSLSDARRSLPQPLAAFRGRRNRSLGRDRGHAVRRCAKERARTRIDLAITSVLLDAGAGRAWRYVDVADRNDTRALRRSRVASLRLFARGAFSGRAGAPFQPMRSALSSIRRRPRWRRASR